MTIQDLPLINACLNGLATVFLVLGFVFIKKGNKTAHRNSMISAFVTSAVFLACYLIYHFNTGSTKFVEPAWFKPIYFTILITHIILAVVILPPGLDSSMRASACSISGLRLALGMV